MAKPSWLNVSPLQGSGNGTISNSSVAHTGRVKREGTVTVTGSGVATPATYRVIQTPLAEFVSFDNGTEMAVSKNGGAVTITGKSNSSKLNFTWVRLPDNTNANIAIPALENKEYTAAGEETKNGQAINGDPGATSQYEFSLILNLGTNPLPEELEWVLLVTADGGQTAQITIKQSAGDAFLAVVPTEITIPQDGSAVSVTVSSNTNWSVS